MSKQQGLESAESLYVGGKAGWGWLRVVLQMTTQGNKGIAPGIDVVRPVGCAEGLSANWRVKLLYDPWQQKREKLSIPYCYRDRLSRRFSPTWLICRGRFHGLF